METILQTTNLTKCFKNKIAVNNVSMHIEKGDIYGFVGKNAAGKTTFMRTILGMATPTSGTVSLFGGMSPKQSGKKIGALIETPGLYQNYSAIENMKRFAILNNSPVTEIYELLTFVGLENAGNKKVKHFSLGMKQRLGIAIAMLGNPEFMVLDEPVNGLDPAGIKQIRDTILKLNKERNVTFLISSHLLDELSKIATKYGIISNGCLVEEFSAESLTEKCKAKITFQVDNVERAVEILSQAMPSEDLKVTDNTIVLLSHSDNSAELNALLVKNDVLVKKIEFENNSVENFFIERMG